MGVTCDRWVHEKTWDYATYLLIKTNQNQKLEREGKRGGKKKKQFASCTTGPVPLPWSDEEVESRNYMPASSAATWRK